jgi:hypothetical protein
MRPVTAQIITTVGRVTAVPSGVRTLATQEEKKKRRISQSEIFY